VTKACFAIPGDLNTPTGGYIYDRTVMGLLPGLGVELRHLVLPDGFPFPSAADLAETGRLLASVPADEVLVIDGLALGVLPPSLLARVAAPIIALHHHPLGLETGIAPERGEALLASERAATAMARHVIVTSQTTAATLAELGFAPPPPVTVAIPGVAPGPRSTGSQDGGFAIIGVGTIVPRKGYDILIAALAKLRDERWSCTIVGGLDRDVACADALRAQMTELGLQERIHFAGVLGNDEIDALYGRSDLFALPSRYEGYGMAFAGAMSRGLPILATRAPAIPSTVPPEAGILVEPDNVDAFADALLALMRDPDLRRRLGDGGWAHAQTLPRWEDTAAIIAGVIKEVGA
jgi:glycosyltransferase involved in cell wall biosynthesis